MFKAEKGAIEAKGKSTRGGGTGAPPSGVGGGGVRPGGGIGGGVPLGGGGGGGVRMGGVGGGVGLGSPPGSGVRGAPSNSPTSQSAHYPVNHTNLRNTPPSGY